jgi:hypothetical protein
MAPSREWVPPKRNTEDPSTPTLPGMPQIKAPRITPSHPLYHQAHNHEVWGSLAHPDLHEENPFLNKEISGYGSYSRRGSQWRQENGGWADKGDDLEGDPERLRRHVQNTMDKAIPAIAISSDPLHQVLESGRVKSQFETNTSGGVLEPESRRDVEHKFFGYSHNLPSHARPIYGYLTNDPLKHHPGAGTYGDHTLVLHRPRIWHRTSAFIGDTLDHQGYGTSAHPVQDFGLSGFHDHSDPRHWRLDHNDYDRDVPYTEAHYHGGVGLRDIHYAVLRNHESWDGTMDHQDELKKALNHHKIPWVEVNGRRGGPVEWEHHLGRLMASAAKGAHMHSNQSSVIGQQGHGRYLIDLGYDDENGNRQAQIADMNTGKLHPPMSKDSILARGYWDEPSFPVDVHDVLPHVNPV